MAQHFDKSILSEVKNGLAALRNVEPEKSTKLTRQEVVHEFADEIKALLDSGYSTR